jgi:hypothetical protein
MDHFLFMQNGYRIVDQGAESSEAQQVRADHRGCRLGTWYYEGQGAEMYSQVPSYSRLERPHVEVHRNVHEAAALLGSRWESDPEVQDRIFAHFQAAERASTQVVQVIDRMVEERHQQA